MRALALVLLIGLVGCGQKGPLYLPDKKKTTVPAPQPAPTPAPSGASPAPQPTPTPAPTAPAGDR
jgi:predicted small lipoprotein YifL